MRKLLLLSFFMMSLQAAQLDPTSSTIKWRGTKITGDSHYGRIFTKSSSFEVKKGKLRSGQIVMDINSFTVDDLEGEWATKFLTHMKSKDFFNVEKYPTAKLVISEVENNKATGDLTVMGVTKKVVFPITKKGDQYHGKLSFDRTKFGMVYGSGSFFKNLGDKAIKNMVDVDFVVALK